MFQDFVPFIRGVRVLFKPRPERLAEACRGVHAHSRSKGWRSGESTRLPPMWPGFESRRRRHLWVEFVVGSLLCSERFFSGYSGIPLSFAPRGFSPGTPVFPSPLLREVYLRVLWYSPLLCSEGFFSGYSSFPLSSKTNISKFQFDQESGRRRTTLWMCYLQIIIHL